MAFAVYLVLFLAFTGHSSALYCICKDGVGDASLQKSLDYACGAGADCTPILQNGVCYNPNTVKDHCSYAVNSYFQKKGQSSGTCDFSGTAVTSANPPSNLPSTCSFPSSATSTNTNTTTPSTTTPTTGGTTTTTPTSTTGGTTPTVFGGLGPTGSGTGINDSGCVGLFKTSNLFFTFLISTCLVVVVVVPSLWG
ncbi:hypothetical protein Ddye_030868 [Dipteronia dyeriana]|uniref:X8 domain-containing protein n=1 Tax=Dipteronia dyeriana TaxID=168575 RepID=A0AAD9WLZ4_9ROSI|nr:hypothetical protein Ddye_030868 [Dipteronia dyeriana]